MPTDLLTLAAPARNRFFYGLLMDAERFQKDQDYFLRKLLLADRFVAGAGVVCGCDLTWTAATSTLTLAPGLVFDRAGRQIVVPTAATIDVTQLTDAQGKPTGPVPSGATILISILYVERKTDPVAVLVHDCDHPGNCAPSSVEEGYRILITTAGAPPSPPGCSFGSFPSSLKTAVAQRVASSQTQPPSDSSIPLGRLDLPSNALDAVSDRPIVYNNGLLFDLIACLAERVAQLAPMSLVYISGDNQAAQANQALAQPLAVEVVDSGGNPVASASTPAFSVTAGGGSIGAVTSPSPGFFETVWTLGASGPQTAVAKSSQSALTVTFNATVTP